MMDKETHNYRGLFIIKEQNNYTLRLVDLDSDENPYWFDEAEEPILKAKTVDDILNELDDIKEKYVLIWDSKQSKFTNVK